MLSKDCSVCRVFLDDEIPAPYVFVHRFNHSLVVLATNQYYQGRCELWYNQHATELFHLSGDARKGFCDEISMVGQAIFNLLQPMKINYEILGNTVPHVHCHVTPRYQDDVLPMRPIWENPEFKAVEWEACMSKQEKLVLADKLAVEIQKLQ